MNKNFGIFKTEKTGEKAKFKKHLFSILVCWRVYFKSKKSDHIIFVKKCPIFAK